MKIENQVCTLEQAKRLKELGVDAVSYMRWVSDDDKTYELVPAFGYSWTDFPDYGSSANIHNAYTVAELGVMTGEDMIKLGVEKMLLYKASSSTEAECRSSMLIYLIENNHITASEVNQRLQAA